MIMRRHSISLLLTLIYLFSIRVIQSSQSSLKNESVETIKKINEIIFNLNFNTTNFINSVNPINVDLVKEKFTLFQNDLLKKRNSLCLFEIHHRFDWSFIKLNNDFLKNFTSTKELQTNNDLYISQFVKNMNEKVGIFKSLFTENDSYLLGCAINFLFFFLILFIHKNEIIKRQSWK